MIDLSIITNEVLGKFWQGFLNFVPKLVLALVVFIIGWLISEGIGKLIEEILKRLKLDKLSRSKRWSESLQKADFETSLSGFVGAICKWILIIVVLWLTVDILLPANSGFSEFLHAIVTWLPNLVIAILIFVSTVIFANFSEKIVKVGVEGAKVGYSKLAGTITRWAIWIFGIAAILLQLGIAQQLILVLFQGIVAILVLAGGLSFGLGGKDVAAEWLKKFKNNLSK